MSATIFTMPAKRERPTRTPEIHPMSMASMEGLWDSCDGISEAINESASVDEVHTLYQYLSMIEEEMARLVDIAGKKCQKLLEQEGAGNGPKAS